MSLSDEESNSGGNQRRAWAQSPTTQAWGEAAKKRLEARLLELLAAAQASGDSHVAYIAGCIATEAFLIESIVVDHGGKKARLVYSIRFEKVED